MRINEIFYSLQGEGRYTGAPAVFIRLSGCNLACPFCDTQHEAYEVIGEEQVVRIIGQYPTRHVVLTGGEPLMQVNAKLTDLLHAHGYFIQVETNGTQPIPEGVQLDWITSSPKTDHLALQHVDELKVLYQGEQSIPVIERWSKVPCQEYRIQPCDVKDPERNEQILQGAVRYILAHPQWSLSLQTHKMINIQ